MKRLPAVLLLLIVGSVTADASRASISLKQGVAQAKAEWLAQIRAAAQSGDRSARFPSPSRAGLTSRLGKAAKLYGFRAVSVQMLHPLSFTILHLFDPRYPTPTNPSGYAYEAYFLVAQTSRGVSFLATFNHWRAPHVGGGQWAASDSLYPFPHGQVAARTR